MKKYHVKLTLTSELLGAVAKNKEVYTNYIASKAAEINGDELETIQQVEESGWTGFHELNGTPILYDYVIKGFLKDACSMLKRAPGTKSAKMTAFKKIIDGTIFVSPRQIPITLSGPKSILERPLRAETAQGPRVALARSDTAPIGSTIEFDVICLGGVDEAVLQEWFDYGQFRGLGQWRNGGYGSFTYELSEIVP